MTREEIIKGLEGYIPWADEYEVDIEVLTGALELLKKEPCDDAISRQAVLDVLDENSFTDSCIKVRQLPSVNPQPCDDAISREAVKELIKCGVSTDTYDDVDQVCKWIDALPSVNPQKNIVNNGTMNITL